MTSLIFTDWIKSFNRSMKLQNRKVLLLLDNAPSHIVPSTDLSNVEVHFLPPNTTSHIQPMDAGIINAFKAHYRRRQVNHLIDAFEAGQKADVALNDATSIRYTGLAWDAVSPNTIKNCWKRVGLFDDGSTDSVQTQECHDYGNIFERLAQAFDIPTERLMSTNDFEAVDTCLSTENTMTEDDILEMVRGNEEEEDEEEPDEEPVRPPTLAEARNALNVLRRFAESNTNFSDRSISAMKQLEGEVLGIAVASKKQTCINKYFKNVD